jgi:large subunit ribosomal protein L24
MNKIRKGDQVVVTTGKDKGKRGTVLRVVPETEKIVVEGINRVKKHQKPNPMKGQTGGIVEKEMPLHVSNVAIFNAATGKPDRVGFKFLAAQGTEKPRKVRFFKSNGEVVDA